jgi:hypothetical protein
MADWNKFWEMVDQEVPSDAVRPGNSDIGIYGDYLEGQYVMQSLNQVCRECELRWYVDWSSIKMDTMASVYRYFMTYMTGDLVITDGDTFIRRPGMGVGRCMCPKDRDTQEILQTPADHQIDTVMKTALTDFIKNAAMRLGRYFGGELYFDERMAGVLGWEIASDRATRYDDVTAGPEELGAVRIPDGGWGRDKKFGGMTLAEVYEDPDGHGAMSWCAADESRQGSFINKKMAQYFNLREGEVPYDESITISYDRAEGINHLLQSNIGEGRLFGHANHVRNHLKSHFGAAKVVDLTVEKADAFVRYIESGGKDKDPRWYAEPVEELFGPESIDELLKKAASHLSETWQDKPLMWWKKMREQYSIGKLNAKQLEGVRILLLAVASGGIDLNNTESDTYKMFLDQMQGIADDG